MTDAQANRVDPRSDIGDSRRMRISTLCFGVASVLFFGACGDEMSPDPRMPVDNPPSDLPVDQPSDDPSDPMDPMDPMDPPPPPSGVAALGFDTHSMDGVDLVVIGEQLLRRPRDLGFNPERPSELWVVNQADDSIVIYHNTGTPDQRAEKRIDPYALHFMEEVSSISFGAPGTFGTCQDSRNTYNNQARANDFMGPTLWSSDLDIFARSNPAAVDALGFDLGSHLDMLHESPLCVGIKWDHDNVYWTFDGLTGSISRYDFVEDHGIGYDDHSDGIIDRYVEGQVSRVEGVPSHLELDRTTGRLFIADTGNARIATLDTNAGRQGRTLRVIEPGTSLHQMIEVDTETFIDAAAGELVRPSGLLLVDRILYVTDNATSRITAFDVDTKERLDYLDTGLPEGSLMGLTADTEGHLFLVDAVANRVLAIRPKS